MKKRLYILLLATFFISTQAFAQFYTGGDDDGSGDVVIYQYGEGEILLHEIT